MSSPADGSAPSTRLDVLRDRLDRLVPATFDVEAEGALAVIRPRSASGDTSAVLDASIRRTLVDAARECGFTHIALELTPPTDRSVAPTDADVHRPEPRA